MEADLIGRKPKPLADRFWPKVDRRGPDDCWGWAARLADNGYGVIWDRAAQSCRHAHRVSYELHNGPIPDGMCVCHRCDNRKCVNPAHLFLGTPADNAADCKQKGRQARGERQGAAKLTDELVRLIRASSKPQNKLAAELGVSHSLVNQIKGGKWWKHVS